MNGLERALLDRRVAALGAILPDAAQLATVRTEDDIAAKERALRLMERYIEAGEAMLEARERPDDPLPLLPEPASLVGGLRLRAYVATFGLLKDELTMPGYWNHVQAAVDAGVPLTWGHSTDHLIGRLETAAEDAHGLFVTALVYPPTCEWQKTIKDALAHGLIGAMSYYSRVSTRYPAHLATLCEITVTQTPADPDARILAVEPL